MPDATAAPHALSNLLRWVIAVLLIASAGLAGMAFWVMFHAVRDVMLPFFGALAWAVPVGTDLGLIIASVLDVVFQIIGIAWRPLRWAAATFIGLQLALNVGAAHGSWLGSAGHAALPVLFVVIIEAWRHFVRKRRNLVVKTERDRIPLARWFADPFGTRELRRLMVLWGVMDIADALDMLQQIELAEAILRRVHGKKWRHLADADLLVKLHTRRYLAEAFAAVKAIGVQRIQNQAAANTAPAKNADQDKSDSAAANCCEPHRQIGTGTKVAFTPAAAQAMNRSHLAAHGAAIGANTLQKIFPIGTARARQLRDELDGSTGSTGAVDPVGAVESSGRGDLIGSVNGSGGDH